MKKTLAWILIAALLMGHGTAFAHDDATLDATVTPHGGQMRMAGIYHFELVLAKDSKTAKDNDGLRRFKLGWGAAESELKYFKYDLRGKSFAVDQDAIAGWHNTVFRWMPLPLSRMTGALLYRHMA